MKDFVYYLKALIGLLLISIIVGVFVGIIFKSDTYIFYTVSI